MLHKFFENQISDVLIKNILSSTPLPIHKFVRSGNRCVAGQIYIYNNYVVKCIQSGIVEGEPLLPSISEMHFGSRLQAGTALFEKVRVVNESYTYFLGDRVKNVTEDHICNTSNYDGDTHKWLGEYLRCFRDKYDINLMPYYNCFNYKLSQDLRIESSGQIVPRKNSKSKVILIPIKFNQTYTIAIDCGAVSIKPILYDSTGLMKNSYYASSYLVDEFGSLFKTISYPYLSFAKPITYRLDTSTVPEMEEEVVKYEKYLYLVLQTSVQNQSSIVVLEGDYTHSNTHHYFNSEAYINKYQVDEFLQSRPSLLRMNDGQLYSYDDNLIPYLLHNVITHQETIGKNILRVQQAYNKSSDAYIRFVSKIASDQSASEDMKLNSMVENDVWNQAMRYKLYELYTTQKQNIQKVYGPNMEVMGVSYNVAYNRVEDINGFVDQKMEKYLNSEEQEVYM